MAELDALEAIPQPRSDLDWDALNVYFPEQTAEVVNALGR